MNKKPLPTKTYDFLIEKDESVLDVVIAVVLVVAFVIPLFPQ